MQIKVKVMGEKEKMLKVKPNSTVLKIIKKLKMNPEIVVVKKNDRIVPLEETLKEGDKVEIIRVISGG